MTGSKLDQILILSEVYNLVYELAFIAVFHTDGKRA
jgi:hypothetical protein